MPVEVAELLTAQRPLEDLVLEFLHADRSKAFSFSEIYAAVHRLRPEIASMMFAMGTLSGGVPKEPELRAALVKLVERGVVREGRLHDIAHYYAVTSAP